MTKTSFLSGIAAFATLAASLSPAIAQPRRAAPAAAASGGTAQYWMSADTTSGLAAQTGMSGRRARRRPLAARRLRPWARGGRPQAATRYVRNLKLELGSPRRAAAPQADHFIPAGLNAGPSCPWSRPSRRGRVPSGPIRARRRRRRCRARSSSIGAAASMPLRPALRDRPRPPGARPGDAGHGQPRCGR